MKKYQLFEEFEEGSTAGSKAQSDIHFLAGKRDYSDIIIYKHFADDAGVFVKFIRKFYTIRNWLVAYCGIERSSIVFWQGPNAYTTDFGCMILRMLIYHKKVKLIGLLHDIDELRMGPSAYLKKSKKQHNFILRYADAVIVHNNKMKDYLIQQGVCEKKLIPLHIFDYLSDVGAENNAVFEKSITIAGNLDISKAGYLKELRRLDRIVFHLYGPNYSLENNENIEYHGVVHPNELPTMLQKGFGLIWDGVSINECSGKVGNYLRYNNPHKLSLYLSSALPVVIWDQAAEADFVRNNNVGICVASLAEACEQISNMNESEYNSYAQNAKKLAKELRSGLYLKQAIYAAEDILEATT